MRAHDSPDKAASGTDARRSRTARTDHLDSPQRTPGSAEELLALQRTVGNAAVARMMEQEAEPVQRSSVHDVLSSPGRPMDGPLRQEMEARLGADFSGVRVHDDSAARRSAAEIGARAYTSDNHVVIGTGGADKHTWAHELTHVVQQRSGPVAGTDTGDGLAVSDPSDRFEREAEQVAAQAMGGAAPPMVDRSTTAGATLGAGESTPVARMISVADFHARTKATFSRGKKIVPVEEALAAYHALPQGDYVARRTQLEVLQRAGARYLNESKSGQHETAVKALVGESQEETNAIRLPALIQETLQRAAGHQQIYDSLIDAQQQADPIEELRRLLRAQDRILAQLELGAAGAEPDLVSLNGQVMEWLSIVSGRLPAPAEGQRPLVEDDLRLLTEMSTDPGVPQTTRTILTELLANQGITEFRGGSPGTTLSGPGGDKKYTLKNMINPPLGTTERLGALTHELTHVDAGEAYANTAILLLFRQGVTDDEIKRLADQRKEAIERLRSLLGEHQGLADEHRKLFVKKLDYALNQGRLTLYAANFKSTNKIDQDTYDRLIQIHNLTQPNSGLLVEYDTVINQLLVYLHRWGVDPEEPLYVETLRLAEQQRQERRAGSAEHPS